MGFDLVQIEKDKIKTTAKKKIGVGCENCPANHKSITKIFGKVRGKKLFIFAQNPGPEENKKGKELVGPSGEWLWNEFGKVGIKREDCDIQNVVRCFTFDEDEETGYRKMRAPNKEELHHCSVYNDKAIAKSKAKIYAIFGQVAAKQIFGNEFKKDKRMFWSERLDAKVYVLDHPAYFLRGAPQTRLDEFRSALKAIAEDLGSKKEHSRYQYIESQDYKGIYTYKEARKEARLIKKAGRKGVRVTVDIEDDIIDKHTDKCYGFSKKDFGQRKILVIGFCFKPGRSRVFFVGDKRVKKVVIDLLKDKHIAKVMQHGSYDWKTTLKLWGIRIANFHYDTQYAEWLAYPGRYSYALMSIVDNRFQTFSGYKTITLPEALPKHFEWPKPLAKAPLQKQYDFVSKKGLLRHGQLPRKKMVLYNGADNDVTKRIEVTTKKKVSLPLLSIYTDCSFVTDMMEKNGPWFDFYHLKLLKKLYPPRLEKATRKLLQIAGKDFNPNSPLQVKKVIYGKLKLKYPFKLAENEKPDTQKKTLEVLAREHEFPKLLLLVRRLSKIKSTYLDGYEECAKINGGKLRTKWWLTGTRTGRMSSGGNKDESDLTVVNLQNVHGDPNLQNLLVSDPEWRKLYEAVLKEVKRKAGSLLHKIAKLVFEITRTENKDKKGKLTALLYEKLLPKIRAKLKGVSFGHVIKKFGNIKIFLGFDFGQIEVRVMAMVAGDDVLIKDCMSGDIHSMVGHAMTGWPVEQIKKDKKTRTLTKNIHFGMLFGLSKGGVYNFIKVKDPDAKVTEEDCEKYYDNYFKRYKKVKRFTEKIREFVEEHGYVENMFGFRRPLNVADVPSDDEQEVYAGDEGHAYWGNQALNTPVQGAAHQLMLMSLSKFKTKAKKYLKMLGVPPMEVHDALYMFVRLKDILKAKAVGHELLEQEPLRTIKKLFPKIKWKVPLVVEGKVGFRLGDSVEIEREETIPDLIVSMFLETFMREVTLATELKCS